MMCVSEKRTLKRVHVCASERRRMKSGERAECQTAISAELAMSWEEAHSNKFTKHTLKFQWIGYDVQIQN